MEVLNLPHSIGSIQQLLSTWVSRIPRLTTLTLFSSTSIPKELGAAIAKHCPNFQRLCFRHYPDEEGCPDIAQMLSQLPRNSLQTFEFSVDSMVARFIFTTLSQHHAEWLTHLSMQTQMLLTFDATHEMLSFQKCIALKHIFLRFDGGFYQAPPSLELVNWLRNCQRLNTLEISLSNPSTVLGFLDCKETRLKHLVIKCYSTLDDNIVDLLCCQKELETLELVCFRTMYDTGGTYISPSYSDKLVKWILEMPSLKVPDFRCLQPGKEDLLRISRGLPFLETFSFVGCLTNLELADVWYSPPLKSLRSHALRDYSFEDIEDFILRMGALNRRTLSAAPIELVGWFGEEPVEFTPAAKKGRYSGSSCGCISSV